MKRINNTVKIFSFLLVVFIVGCVSQKTETVQTGEQMQMEKLDAKSGIPDIIVEESGRLDNIITDFLDVASPKIPDLHPCRVEDII